MSSFTACKRAQRANDRRRALRFHAETHRHSSFKVPPCKRDVHLGGFLLLSHRTLSPKVVAAPATARPLSVVYIADLRALGSSLKARRCQILHRVKIYAAGTWLHTKAARKVLSCETSMDGAEFNYRSTSLLATPLQLARSDVEPRLSLTRADVPCSLLPMRCYYKPWSVEPKLSFVLVFV